uniref:Sorting nexin-4 n=1 Tax=Cacopsylla melanoneura TaxID=428564 RepID=A0A8D9EMW2_9HEMI
MTSTDDSDDVTTDANEAKDPEQDGCLLDHMEISIADSEKRTNSSLNIREFYTVYLIETKVTNENWSLVSLQEKLRMVWRRYSEFEQMRVYLQATYPYVILPPLPEKRPTFVWKHEATSTDITDPDFVDRRRVGLENFLHRIASHPSLCYDKLFLSFLRQESGWKETFHQATSSSSSAVVNSSLVGTNTILASGKYFISNSQQQGSSCKLKYPHKQMERLKCYADNLNKSLGAVLRVRCRQADRLYLLHKIHENYGKVLCEWSAIEREMGDGLQKAGHFFDSIAEFITPALEDEQLVADQMKEYWLYSSSLQAVYKQYELDQHALEVHQQSLADKKYEKLKLEQGGQTNHFLLKIFGSIDSDDVREMKLRR